MRKDHQEGNFFRILGLVILVAFTGCSTAAPYHVYVTPGMPMRVQLQYTTGTGKAGGGVQPAQATPPQSPYWTGNGGSGRSITILPPRGVGLAEAQANLPDIVASELVHNFSKYSDITLFDRVTNSQQYDELLSFIYSEDDPASLDYGHLASTELMLLGNLTRTSTGYLLQLTVNRNSDKTTAATYSEAVTLAQLENLTSVRLASLELLRRLGVQLTAQAQTEMTRTASLDQVNAQTAYAQGMIAQRQGTEVAALTYFFQAEALDASLAEAVSRTTVLDANIRTGNIGANIRNDFAWGDAWKAKLTETETVINDMLRNTNPQRSLWYTALGDNAIWEYEPARDLARRTTELRIDVALHTHAVFPVSVQRTVQAVYDGLQATGRAQAWQFNNWPRQGVTTVNPFNSRWGSVLTVVFEVLNDQGRVIGRQTVEMDSRFSLSGTRLEGPGTAFATVRFTGVDGLAISDRLNIRIASINGRPPEEAGISRIEPVTVQQMQASRSYTIYNGAIRPSTDNRNLGALTIPAELWSERVTAIPNGAFERRGITSISIPSGIASIGANAFANNQLSAITIPDSVALIGDSAFVNNRLARVTIQNEKTIIGNQAFDGNNISQTIIGTRVTNGHLSLLRIENGIVLGFNQSLSSNQRAQIRDLVIPDNVWGRPVTAIANEAFRGNQLISVTIPESVRSIGDMAFLTSITTSTDSSGNSTTTYNFTIERISIGNNINIGSNAFSQDTGILDPEVGFKQAYEKNQSAAGSYTDSSGYWGLEGSESARVLRGLGRSALLLLGLCVVGAGIIVGLVVLLQAADAREAK